VDEANHEFRDRIVEVLALLSSREYQLEYQAKAPINVSNELFNQWEDWYYPDAEEFRCNFEPRELLALEAFHRVFEQVSNDTPKRMPPIEEFVQTAHWRRLNQAARVALSALGGRVPDE
jgi:hypothetical protein